MLSPSDKSKIYLKQVDTIGDRAVWLVDGGYVRANLNENFVVFDEHNHLPFIPARELWIDQDTNPSEWHFFITRMLTLQWAVAEGLSVEEADKKALRAEKRERAKLLAVEHASKNEVSAHETLEKIRLDLLERSSSEHIKVWLVDGKAVRDYCLTDYGDGGHDLVYSFIPKGEIWIEDTLPPQERKYIILHELHERFLMSEGKDYPHAHRGATEVEDRYREHPELDLSSRIKEELQKNEAQA